MNKQTIIFEANEQTLTFVSGDQNYASNTVDYVEAVFRLGENWDFDVIVAVWQSKTQKIATVLGDGVCIVPTEVLAETGVVKVNLAGSDIVGDVVEERLTTYPEFALLVDATAQTSGTETQPITPSQFEQFVGIVAEDADRAETAKEQAQGYAEDASEAKEQAQGFAEDAEGYKDDASESATQAGEYKDEAKGYAEDAEADAEEIRNMRATANTLPAGSSATANYSDGLLTLGIPKGDKGATGATGNGIASSVLNADYTLTLNFTDGTHYTTPPIRGAQGVQGETGNGIESVYLTETHGAVKTYTILFTDGTTTTFDVTDGEVTLAELASVLPTDTASGAIASFEDGSDLFDYLSCIVNIEPVQDLHGYDKPWVGGAGKNLLPITINTQTVNGITFTVNKDNAGNVISISISGTATAVVTEIELGAVTLNVGGYKINGNTYASGNLRLQLQKRGQSKAIRQVYNGSDVGFSVSETAEYYVTVVLVGSGVTFTQTVYPMIRLATKSDATFAPYSNLCPITGWTGCEVDVVGFNQWDEQWELGSYDGSGQPIAVNTVIRSKNYISVFPSTGYYILAPYNGVVYYYDATKTFISLESFNSNGVVKTTPTNCRYVHFRMASDYGTTYNHDISINYPSTDHSYHAHNPNSAVYPVSWQTEAGTVYGGYLTIAIVDGELKTWVTVDRAMIDIGDKNWTMKTTGTYNGFYTQISGIKYASSAEVISATMSDAYKSDTYSNAFSCLVDQIIANGHNGTYVFIVDSRFSDASVFKATMTGHKICYELATPQTYQLDPVQVACLLGQNNVWADCGDIEEVKYKADVQLWVEKQLREINTAILALS